MIYLLTAVGLTPGGTSTVNIYTQEIHRTTQSTQTMHRTAQLTNWEEHGPCSTGRAPSLRVIPWHLPYEWFANLEQRA